MSLEAGTRIGRYTVSRLIAQGGMAEVYRAEQDLTGGITRPVAVKVIRPEYSESSEFREMFLDEARTACTLSHPNIVHIYEVGESDEGQLFMVMELVAGETLATINRTMRSKEQRFSDEALFAIGVACCSALEAVHALTVEGGTVNLVHRDVSPHNLLLSSAGALKLIDFGIAKAATNRNLTMPGVTKGKAGYFSPEQAMGKRLDGRSDLFSLGVTLYKLASGATPFDDFANLADRHAALVRGQWKSLDLAFPGLPAGLSAVVSRSLMVKPEQRYQTAREMRDALEKAAFDARLRLGQSSLLGYVDDQGALTAGGGSRSSIFPAVQAPPLPAPPPTPAPPPAPARTETVNERAVPPPVITAPGPVRPPRPMRTERLDPVPPPPPRSPLKNPLVVLAFVGSVALGVGLVVWLTDPTAPLPVAVTPVVPPAPTPTPVEPPKPLPRVVVPDVEVRVEPEPVKRVEAPPVAPVPAPRPPRPVRPPAPSPEKKEPAAVEAAIPAGEGKLRINVSGARASILVGGDDWGEPPVNRKVASGALKVTVKLADGSSSSTRAVVLPDQTTIVTFDASTQKWSTRTQ
jgi:serine/threonine-protein kinase